MLNAYFCFNKNFFINLLRLLQFFQTLKRLPGRQIFLKMLLVRRLKKVENHCAKEMALFLIVENASLATTYPDVCTAYMMYMTVPVTTLMAERSFLNSN